MWGPPPDATSPLPSQILFIWRCFCLFLPGCSQYLELATQDFLLGSPVGIEAQRQEVRWGCSVSPCLIPYGLPGTKDPLTKCLLNDVSSHQLLFKIYSINSFKT